MAIQVASLFASVGVDPSGLIKGLGSAKQSLQKFGGELAKQVIGTVSLATAVYKAGQVVAQSVRDWADYADGMRLSAQMAGITTEEMSRLSQAADDFRVPIETMQRAMEMALKNGFVPTIENIAALSDQLLGITDPAARAAAASKIFGKSYADMMPFLLAGGDAIRDVTDGISDSLVVTAEAAQQAKEYKDALDALGDAWTGFKNKIGQFAVPAITDVINNLAGQPTELMKMQDVVTAAAKKAFDDKKISAEEYQAVLDNVSTSTGTYTEYVSKLNFILGILNKTNGEAATSTEGLSGAELLAAEAAEAEAAAIIAAAEAQAKMHAELLNVTSLDANYSGIIDLGYQFTDMLAEQETLQAERNKLLSQGWSQQSTKVKELTDNIAGLDADMKKMADQVTLDMFKATIAIGGVTQAELMAYMQMAIDMGYMSEEGAKAAVDAYSNAIGTINGLDIDEKTVNVEIDALAAFATLDLLQAYALKDKHAQAVMHVQFQYGTPAGEDYDQYDIGGYPQGNQASGGHAMADTPYIVGERGPELFVPNANGQVISNNELGGGNSELLGDILLELQNQPSRMKVAIKEAFALVGG